MADVGAGNRGSMGVGVARGAYVAELLDGYSAAMLDATGVGPGYRCLELGTVGGSIPRWLAGRVAPSGGVVARERAVAAPAEGPFDLIHARLVLPHLTRRPDVLHGLTDTLRPGGWLVVGDFSGPLALESGGAGHASDTDLFACVLNDLHGRLHQTGGGDGRWISVVEEHLAAIGMAEVQTASYDQCVRGGESGCLRLREYITQVHDQLLSLGHRRDDLHRFQDLMLDPGFCSWFHEFRCIRARKPLPRRATAQESAKTPSSFPLGSVKWNRRPPGKS